jgi:hypothetical protein
MTGSRLVSSVLLLSACLALTGCDWAARGITPPERPNANELMVTFNKTTLNQSSSGDVVASVLYPTLQYVTQSQNTVAISGSKRIRARNWLTLISFGERLTASGKYFFLINDKPQAFMYTKLILARLDVEKTITPEVLNKNYPDEEVKNIAILRDILSGFNASVREVKSSDAHIRSCSMAVDQLLGEILTRLKTSSIEASRFADPDGMPFDNSNMGTGRLRMVIEGDIVKLKIIIGSVSEDMATIPDVKNM